MSIKIDFGIIPEAVYFIKVFIDTWMQPWGALLQRDWVYRSFGLNYD